MQSVESIMVLVRVLACKIITVIHILVVDLNAYKALIAHVIMLVSIQSVSIHVKMRAVWMPNVQLSIIHRCAIVYLVTLEMRLSVVIRSQTIVRFIRPPLRVHIAVFVPFFRSLLISFYVVFRSKSIFANTKRWSMSSIAMRFIQWMSCFRKSSSLLMFIGIFGCTTRLSSRMYDRCPMSIW